MWIDALPKRLQGPRADSTMNGVFRHGRSMSGNPYCVANLAGPSVVKPRQYWAMLLQPCFQGGMEHGWPYHLERLTILHSVALKGDLVSFPSLENRFAELQHGQVTKPERQQCQKGDQQPIAKGHRSIP